MQSLKKNNFFLSDKSMWDCVRLSKCFWEKHMYNVMVLVRNSLCGSHHREHIRMRLVKFKPLASCSFTWMVYQDLVIKLRFIVFHASKAGPDTNVAYVDLPITSSNSWKCDAFTFVPGCTGKMKSTRTIAASSLRLRYFIFVISDINLCITYIIYIIAILGHSKIFKSNYYKL